MKIQGSYVVLEALVGFLEQGKSSSSGRSSQQQGVLGLGWQRKGMGKGKARCCLQLCCLLPPNESQNHRISISLTCKGTINTTGVWGALRVSDSFAKGMLEAQPRGALHPSLRSLAACWLWGSSICCHPRAGAEFPLPAPICLAALPALTFAAGRAHWRLTSCWLLAPRSRRAVETVWAEVLSPLLLFHAGEGHPADTPLTFVLLCFPAELSQAMNSGTALSKPSPPLPPKRGLLPSTTTEAAPASKPPSDRTLTASRPVLIPMHMAPAYPPPSPSPPLPTHVPPEPPRVPLPTSTPVLDPPRSLDLPKEPPAPPEDFRPPEAAKRTAEQGFGEPHALPRLPQVPLHIRIQQALASPLPVTPPADGSHRAHSLLFENDAFGEDGGTLGRTRSLPVTIEMLKV